MSFSPVGRLTPLSSLALNGVLCALFACSGPSVTPVVAKAPVPPASTSVTVAPTSSTPPPPPPPLTCETLCARANQVAGCATDAANVSACIEVCARMSAGPCKDAIAAELACAARVELACKGSSVDWGTCSAEQSAANTCVKAALSAESKNP